MIRRKVFVSYHHGDHAEVDAFLRYWAGGQRVFIAKALGVSDNDDFISSTNTDYVIGRIRQKYLGDSTVTMVLVGSCTHSRRYVDWELKTTLRRGGFTPNGLFGIILPSQGDSAFLPPRFRDNWNPNEFRCYARYYAAPASSAQLAGWIEDAHDARTSRAHLIMNSASMMRYNARCRVHGFTH